MQQYVCIVCIVYTLQWHSLMTIEDELEDDILMVQPQREEMIEYDDGGQMDRTTAKQQWKVMT